MARTDDSGGGAGSSTGQVSGPTVKRKRSAPKRGAAKNATATIVKDESSGDEAEDGVDNSTQKKPKRARATKAQA